ncbi:head decoration protein [Phenylobacterium sp.]|uniref:head decoration protein n=1 Tax=Phenylobacterium sp. TaxID=1871053 RepID=UPI0027300BD8|nr:head decoration protein [Phenylobacterium sp.]MDP2214765.1 head decoration protein [Phenylobacterium sp.]
MTILTMGRVALAFVLSEAAGMRSRAAEFLGESQEIEPGQPLARVLADTGVEVTAAAVAGNTGNGVLILADPAYSKAARSGRYKAICVVEAANGGRFRVDDPNGVEIGQVNVGAAFNKAVKFAIADGATDFAVGDTFDILVDLDAGGEMVVAWDPTANDGTEIAACLPMYRYKTGEGERLAIATFARDAEIKADHIAWPAGVTAEQKETALQQFALHGLIAR